MYTKPGMPVTASGSCVYGPSGRQFGRISSKRVFRPNGRYVATIVGGRLIYRSHRRWRHRVNFRAASIVSVPMTKGSWQKLGVGERVAEAPENVLGRLGVRADPLHPRWSLPSVTTVRRLLARIEGAAPRSTSAASTPSRSSPSRWPWRSPSTTASACVNARPAWSRKARSAAVCSTPWTRQRLGSDLMLQVPDLRVGRGLRRCAAVAQPEATPTLPTALLPSQPGEMRHAADTRTARFRPQWR
jgi:hypothetical protein